ncbi:MAG: glycosyltransferase family 2 protein [archaeon]
MNYNDDLFKEEKINEDLIHLSVRHLYGIEKVELSDEEVILLCLVKNGEKYIEEFITYYLKLGIKHMVFLDNGSSDKTIDLIKQIGKERVTILQTDFYFGDNNDMRMRDYLINRFAKNKWSLCLDIDEFFDYPYSDFISLKKLIKYLNDNKYTSVVTQMLDMFPEEIVDGRKNRFIRKEHRYYEIFNIEKKDYYFNDLLKKRIKNNIKIHLGGVRKTIFNVNPTLTKHALFFNNQITKRDKFGHLLNKGAIADFSAVLLHYKFTDDFFDYVKDAVEKEYHYDNSSEYKGYYKKLKFRNSLKLVNDNSKELISVKDLILNGFLVVSERYKELIKNEELNAPDSLEVINKISNIKDSYFSSKDDVSVIIGVRNRLDYRLENAFKTLRNQDYNQDLIKILLVDYGSKGEFIPSMKNLSRKYNVSHIRVDNVDVWNRSHALNIGIKMAETKYVLCSDIDIIFRKNFISECVKELKRFPNQVLFCSMRHLLSERVLREFDVIKDFDKLIKRSVFQNVVENCYSYIYGKSIIFILKKFFFKINGYDEKYCAWGAEDDDIIKRFEMLGLFIKNMDDKTSHLHQWHPKYEGLTEEDKEQIKNNRRYLKEINTLKRNKEGWGRIVI